MALFRSASVRCLLWFGLTIGVCHADAPAWRASIGSRVARACGSAVTSAGIDSLLTAKSRAAGITISSVYNAQLLVEVDCVPVSGASVLATHQCLDFAELVPTPSKDGRPALASTWRKCATATCLRSRCDAGVSVAVEEQFHELSAALRDRVSASAPARVPAPPLSFSSEVSRGGLALFYSLYIAACLSLMVYWQVRKQAY